MAELVGTSSHSWKIAGSIHNQGTWLRCRFDPRSSVCNPRSYTCKILGPAESQVWVCMETASQCFSLTSVCLSPFHSAFLSLSFKKRRSSPGWCGSVDWVPACKPKRHWFHSQSGRMPGLGARSSVGSVWEATTHRCFSPSLSPSLPLSLKVIK